MRKGNLCKTICCGGFLCCKEEFKFREEHEVNSCGACWGNIRFFYTHKKWYWTILAILGVFFHCYDMLYADFLYLKYAEFIRHDYWIFYLLLYI